MPGSSLPQVIPSILFSFHRGTLGIYCIEIRADNVLAIYVMSAFLTVLAWEKEVVVNLSLSHKG